MTTTSSTDDSSLFISTHTSSTTYQTQSENVYETESTKIIQDACPHYRLLTDQDEEILMVQRLQTQIVPNHDISQVVSRAIEKHAERIHRQTEILENEFKLINDDIERRIKNASRELDKTLNDIDHTSSTILEVRKAEHFVQFEQLNECLVEVEELMKERNQTVNKFGDVLRDLEKERTKLIEDCYKKHMSGVKRLSGDSYEQLYDKYLKDYNTIKSGNFRTYEDLRFKLIQLSGRLRDDFVLKAHNIKSKIKKNIGKNFIRKFKTATKKVIADKVQISQTRSIDLMTEMGKLFNELLQQSNSQIKISVVLECQGSSKELSKRLDEIIASTAPLQDEVAVAIRKLLTDTIEEFGRVIMDSGESLTAAESTAFNEEMSTEADMLYREKIQSILEVLLFLSDVKKAAEAIDTVLNPAVEVIHNHSERITKARNILLEALDNELKINDSKLNVFEQNFNATLDDMIQASNESDVRNYKHKCINILKHIKNRIKTNREAELEVISNYEDLMTTELNMTGSEVQVILDLFSKNIKKIPKFNHGLDDKMGSWLESMETSILPFRKTVKNCQNALRLRLSTLISELKSPEFLNRECAWATLLRYSIDERFNVATQMIENRIVRVNDGIAVNRLDELEQHRNLFDRHVKAALEASDSLREKTNEMLEKFHRKKKVLEMNVNLVMSNINELTVSEISELTNKLRQQTDSVAEEFNEQYQSHYDSIEPEFQRIAISTLELMKSIKMFPEGGNYGHEEAVNTIRALNSLNTTIERKQIELMDKLKQNSYKPLAKVMMMLSKMIRPVEIELDKKLFGQKYHGIQNLMNVTVNQEILNLEKTMASLHPKLSAVIKTFEKKDVTESSKHWSEMLSETKNIIGFLAESFRDLKALPKWSTVSESSLWNSKSENAYISSKMALNSNHRFVRGKLKFYDYCKTIVTSKTANIPRFLNNINSAIFHYVWESQNNAAVTQENNRPEAPDTDDLATVESNNTWIDQQSTTEEIYNGIMEEALKKSKATVLRAELIWIMELSDLFDFLSEFYAVELKFKNIILTTYHDEFIVNLKHVFDQFERESESARKRSKNLRDGVYYKLKPSHGHPQNIQSLEALLADFRRVNSQCSDMLSEICNRTEMMLKTMAENYEKECPTDVLEAVTLYIDCKSELLTQLDRIEMAPASSVVSLIGESVATLEHTASRLFEKETTELALNDLKHKILQLEAGTVFWPDNKRLWTENVRAFLKLCQERSNDVRMFDTVEKSKLIEWATNFVQNVDKVKKLQRQQNMA